MCGLHDPGDVPCNMNHSCKMSIREIPVVKLLKLNINLHILSNKESVARQQFI